jgi:hypothetical protein
MTPQEQYLDMLAKTQPIRGVNVREVAGGYAVVGSTRYADLITGGIQHEASEEGVAVDPETAVAMTGNYLRNGSFFPAPPTPVAMPLLDMLNAPQPVQQATI